MNTKSKNGYIKKFGHKFSSESNDSLSESSSDSLIEFSASIIKKAKNKKNEFNPSPEQCTIIEEVRKNNNIICDAVAGSGKTTTVLWMAKKLPNHKIIQITYNAQLKLEVREKVRQKSIYNLEIHTYHSLAVKYYDPKAYEDHMMREVVNKNKIPTRKIARYDIIVLDEVQDMTLLYYRLINKFILDIGKKILIVILGDKYQGVYQFKGADTRFLVLAHNIWPNSTPIKHVTLKTSYRVTRPIAWFVNEVMLGEPRITSEKNGPAIEYISDDIYRVHLILIPKILKLLKNNIYEPGDIFVLSASIKNPRMPVRKLENALVKNKIPCYVPISDERKIDEDVTRGKVIFTTFHQAKGRERKVVIIYGFDNSYFEFYEKNHPKNICPSTLYVAVTRTSEKLFLLEGSRNGPLNFMKKTRQELINSSSIKFIESSNKKNFREIQSMLSEYDVTPTELVKFLSEYTIDTVLPILDELFYVEQEAGKVVRILSKVENESGKYEEVSDLNGLVIPSIFQELNSGSNSLMDYVTLEKNNLDKHPFLMDAITKIKYPCTEPGHYLYLANVYSAIREKLYFKLAQIDNYDWLTEDMISECHKYMARSLSKQLIYEKQLPDYTYKSPEFGKIKFHARIDAYDDKIVWEFKCTSELTTEHLLQLVIYCWLWINTIGTTDGLKEFKIINICSGEIRYLKQNIPLINDVIDILLNNKFGKNDVKTDKQFIKHCGNSKINDTFNFLRKNKIFKKKCVYLETLGLDAKLLQANNFKEKKMLYDKLQEDPNIFDNLLYCEKLKK